MSKHICERCGTEFEGKDKRRFCGKRCAAQNRAEWVTLWVEYPCERCGVAVKVKPRYIGRYRFCRSCRYTRNGELKTSNQPRKMRPCEICDRPFYRPPSVKTRTCSRTCGAKLKINRPTLRRPSEKLPSFGKGGFRPDIGIYVRSRWEANYARYLNMLGRDFSYEPETHLVALPDGTKHGYTPDFLVDDWYFVEIKGWLRADIRQLEILEAAKSQLPYPLFVVDKEVYLRLQDRVSHRIQSWEYSGTAAPDKPIRKCLVCNSVIVSCSPRAKFCSSACAGKSKQKRTQRVCAVCGTRFEVAPWEESTKRFCSVPCAHDSMRVVRKQAKRSNELS